VKPPPWIWMMTGSFTPCGIFAGECRKYLQAISVCGVRALAAARRWPVTRGPQSATHELSIAALPPGASGALA
jgi:hypothetical protein